MISPFLNPYKGEMVHIWPGIFKENLFEKLQADMVVLLTKYLEDALAVVPGVLVGEFNEISKECLRHAMRIVCQMAYDADATISEKQKLYSREIEEIFQGRFKPVCDAAMEETGKGSVKRQKVCLATLVHSSYI